MSIIENSLTREELSRILLFGCLLATFYIYRRWSRLRHIPGPALASVTNIPRLIWARSGRAHAIHIELHQKYGKFVRLGPNSVSICDPSAVSQIYGTSVGRFGKSDFYKTLQPMVGGKRVIGIFHAQDESLHRSLKRPIAGLYSMTSLLEFEPLVDSTIDAFLTRVEEVQKQVEPGHGVDLATWLHWFAFDVIGEVTWSKRLGFLDEGKDVGQIPWLDLLLDKNPLLNYFATKKIAPVAAFALDQSRHRVAATDRGNTRDFLSRFMAIQEKDRDVIPESYVTAWTVSNVLAGSDTTAITLRAIVYNLLMSPESLRRLTEELSLAKSQGMISDIVSWAESRRLPYLDACIKEAGRLHPAAGLTLERVVPRDGAHVCGQYFPGGTIVGVNPWVMHRDPVVYGADADRWNPERWLGEDAEQRALMDRCLLTVREKRNSKA
ncbi:hypothetical protein SCUP515_05872 [Seiridium cupressi]